MLNTTRKLNPFLYKASLLKLKRSTDTFHKQIEQATCNCANLIDKQNTKHLLQMKPSLQILRAKLKIHKESIPIRPGVNNINAPSYKLAESFNKKLQDIQHLSKTFTTFNSTQLAHNVTKRKINETCRLIALNVTKLKINETCRLITLDVKDFNVNIPINEILKQY
jgi:hypothetical protein